MTEYHPEESGDICEFTFELPSEEFEEQVAPLSSIAALRIELREQTFSSMDELVNRMIASIDAEPHLWEDGYNGLRFKGAKGGWYSDGGDKPITQFYCSGFGTRELLSDDQGTRLRAAVERMKAKAVRDEFERARLDALTYMDAKEKEVELTPTLWQRIKAVFVS